MSGVNIVGVQFRRAGKIYDFDGKDFILKVGDSVVVDTERGPSLAEVKKLGFADETTRDLSVLKPVLEQLVKKILMIQVDFPQGSPIIYKRENR